MKPFQKEPPAAGDRQGLWGYASTISTTWVAGVVFRRSDLGLFFFEVGALTQAVGRINWGSAQ